MMSTMGSSGRSGKYADSEGALDALFDSYAEMEEERFGTLEKEARELWQSLTPEDIEDFLWKSTKERKINFLNKVRKDGGTTDAKHLINIIFTAKPYETGVIPAARTSSGHSSGVGSTESSGSSSSGGGNPNSGLLTAAAIMGVAGAVGLSGE